MKVTLSSLKQFLQTTASPQEIAQKLTQLGLEVEEVAHLGAGLESFAVAHILSATPHPDADKLRICQVATHTDKRQIVCGAPNARAGIKVVLADIGAVIPANNMVIKPAKIRGVESQGMLCSSAELGLGADGGGIIELPETAQVGAKIIDVLGLNDVLFTIAITPNRGDCLGAYGIARDLAASGLGSLQEMKKANLSPQSLAQQPLVSINSEHCTHFVAYHLRVLTNAPSPKWLSQALESLGQKSISALVDVTNYFSLIYGRPLHVYDAQKLSGALQVRPAMEGEQFKALNGREYVLPAGACVIADDVGVQAIGGIIGGEDSGCTLDTSEIILEAAWFDPIHIANSGRALQIDTDSRYRFERGVDPESTSPLAALASQMIMELCGGEIVSHCEVGSPKQISQTFLFDADYVNACLGLNIPANEQMQLLQNLGCIFADGNITTSSWRSDLGAMFDISEEVARLYGYDNLQPQPLPHVAITTAPPLKQDIARKAMIQRGLDEVVHFAFTKPIYANIFKAQAELVEVLNPISADLSIMRPHLYAHLLQAVASNHARGNQNLAFAEIGNVFFGVKPNEQPLQLAGVRTGGTGLHWRGEKPYDIFSVKADLMAVLANLGVNVEGVQLSRAVPSYYHPHAAGRVSLGAKNTLGFFGELHPAILRSFGIESKVFAFECWLDNVPTPKTKRKANYAVSEFQASKRDFAFIAEANLPAGELQLAIKKAGGALVKSVELFDLYQGDNMQAGKKSLGYNVTLQAPDRTLQEADIVGVCNNIIAAAEKMGAMLR
jgi:phenylalanyl-tRNA synthetase beta chain